MFLKVVVDVLYVGVEWHLSKTAFFKRKERRETIIIHQEFALWTIVASYAAVVATEIMVWHDGWKPHSLVFPIHLLFAAYYIVILHILYFRINGNRFPALHKRLGLSCFASFNLAFVLGLYLQWS